MATADSVKAKIQELITSANTVTGGNSGNLADAVAKLIAGFGSSGNEGDTGTTPGQLTVHMGTYIAPERHENDIVFSTPGGVSHFVLFMNDIPTTGTGCAYVNAIVANKETAFVFIAGSNSSGTMSSAANAYATGGIQTNYYPGIAFGENDVTYITFKPLGNACRLPQPGKSYIWLAW